MTQHFFFHSHSKPDTLQVPSQLPTYLHVFFLAVGVEHVLWETIHTIRMLVHLGQQKIITQYVPVDVEIVVLLLNARQSVLLATRRAAIGQRLDFPPIVLRPGELLVARVARNSPNHTETLLFGAFFGWL